jgi:hypothetical protein
MIYSFVFSRIASRSGNTHGAPIRASRTSGETPYLNARGAQIRSRRIDQPNIGEEPAEPVAKNAGQPRRQVVPSIRSQRPAAGLM